MTEPLNYWYDQQFRRMLMQVTRIFENFTFQIIGKNNKPELRKIPVKLDLTNRQVAAIINENTENAMASLPIFTIGITEVNVSRNRTQAPYYVDKKIVRTRQWDNEVGAWDNNSQGDVYQVDRLMPVPFDVTVKVDLWTDSMMTKHQILEQILVLFNPSLDLQSSRNAYDWGALQIIELTGITWSSRSVPVGTNAGADDIDVSTLTLTIPFWLQPPSYLHQSKFIQQIVMNIYEAEKFEEDGRNEGYDMEYSTSDMMARIIVTPNNYRCLVKNENGIKVAILLGNDGGELDEFGDVHRWDKLIEAIGKYRKNISQFVLLTTTDLDEVEKNIVGTFDFHPSEPNKIIWNIDPFTLPKNTLKPINEIIDPHVKYPGKGLSVPQIGHRYLIKNDIGENQVWNGLNSANINDIVEYDGSTWLVVFDSKLETQKQILTNLKNNNQYSWNGLEWHHTTLGEYYPGGFRLFL